MYLTYLTFPTVPTVLTYPTYLRPPKVNTHDQPH